LKRNYTSKSLLKLITYVLIVVHMGVGSMSIAYLFVDNHSHQIEYCNSFENESLLDELEKEIDDKFKIVFTIDKQSVEACFSAIITADTPLSDVHSDITTPPPEHS